MECLFYLIVESVEGMEGVEGSVSGTTSSDDQKVRRSTPHFITAISNIAHQAQSFASLSQRRSSAIMADAVANAAYVEQLQRLVGRLDRRIRRYP
jgi:hypothetical protein